MHYHTLVLSGKKKKKHNSAFIKKIRTDWLTYFNFCLQATRLLRSHFKTHIWNWLTIVLFVHIRYKNATRVRAKIRARFSKLKSLAKWFIIVLKNPRHRAWFYQRSIVKLISSRCNNNNNNNRFNSHMFCSSVHTNSLAIKFLDCIFLFCISFFILFDLVIRHSVTRLCIKRLYHVL